MFWIHQVQLSNCYISINCYHDTLSNELLFFFLQIRYAVNQVQITNGLSPEISSMLVQELINQLSENVSVASRNHFKSPPQSQLSAMAIHRTVTSRPSIPFEESSEKPLYIITPTYRRPEQIPELTRMAHTLMLVKNIHWLVIEDATVATKQVTTLLERTGLKFDHLIGKNISDINLLQNRRW